MRDAVGNQRASTNFAGSKAASNRSANRPYNEGLLENCSKLQETKPNQFETGSTLVRHWPILLETGLRLAHKLQAHPFETGSPQARCLLKSGSARVMLNQLCSKLSPGGAQPPHLASELSKHCRIRKLNLLEDSARSGLCRRTSPAGPQTSDQSFRISPARLAFTPQTA